MKILPGRWKDELMDREMGIQKSDILISIIIPFYNTEWSLLKECIDSILKQDLSFCQVILIDDCSTNQESVEQCSHYIQNYSNFSMLQNAENKGVSFSRNRGIEAGQGKFLLFFDADDWVEPELLADLYREIKRGEADTVFYEYSRWMNGEKIPCFRQLDEQYYETLNEKMIERMILSNDFNSPCCILYTREIIIKEGIRFDVHTKLGEDFLFNVQYLRYFKSGKHLNGSYYNYRYNSSSVTNTFSLQKVEDTGKGYFCRKELLKQYSEKGKEFTELAKKFYTEYYKSIIVHILNGLNSGYNKGEVFSTLEYEWVQDLVSEDVAGVFTHIKRRIIKNKCKNIFICLSKIQNIKHRKFLRGLHAV